MTDKHTTKGDEMKTTRKNSTASLAGLTVALALFVGIASEVRAQETTKGAGALRLLEINKKPAKTKAEPAKAESKEMSCEKCKDEVLVTRDWTARGATPSYVTIVRHLCKGCKDELNLVGHGRAKETVAMHKCTSCGSDDQACCNMKKGSKVVTKGMEKKKVEVAPLK